MSIQREPIYAALFALVQAAVTSYAVTIARRFQLASQVPPVEQPAVFQVEKSERIQHERRGLPKKYWLSVDLVVYVQAGDSASVPSQLMNQILDAIDAALEPSPGDPMNVQTLGGLVEHAWIEGEVLIVEGTLQDQSVAIVPVQVYVTG
ncbi:hypothetical protein [Burkholderia ubonensis]|uniref:hypothetical protein n=1 Tax=Burkholderia ubonensis TaxID=101571 RepID=UPI000757903C|nr:hypothetical protein [Burkholderia ubonensis]KWN78318.1 hypothetical protein WM24_29515 [Burkholderia ubonensis]